jgi:hypothetical protein
MDHEELQQFRVTKKLRALYLGDGIINERDSDGYTPLHYAVVLGWSAAIRALFQHGADVKLLDPAIQKEEILTSAIAPWQTSSCSSGWHTFAPERLLCYLREWRPRRHSSYSGRYRASMRTLAILAKARKYDY